MTRTTLRLLSLAVLFSLSWAGDRVRPYLATGPWYPADPGQLRHMLESFFAKLPDRPHEGAPLAIVAPHAGLAYSGRCAGQAYSHLKSARGIRRVILLGLSHRSPFTGAVLSNHTHFSTPLGRTAVDIAAVKRLAGQPLFQTDDRIMEEEHSLENQLPLLQYALDGSPFQIVPVLFGSLDRDEFAKVAKSIAPLFDEHTLVVASTDFTHYGSNFFYLPFKTAIPQNLAKLDQGLANPILALDFDLYWAYKEKTKITACGFVPVGVLIKLLETKNPEGMQTCYARSGEMTGDWANSVSYISIIFFQTTGGGKPMQAKTEAGLLSRDEQQQMLVLARRTLERYFAYGREPGAADLSFIATPGLLQEKRGLFVTLRQKGELRGCIGHIVGMVPVYQGVIENSLNAALRDPRFEPLALAELARTDIEISVLTPPQKIPDWHAIRLKTDGVIIRDGNNQAVFLPQVAIETGWNLDQFLGQLCRKAGLPETAYRSSRTMEFYTFQAQVFEEKEKK